MGYFWTCPKCDLTWTFDDDEAPECGSCKARQALAELAAMTRAIYDPEEP